MKINKNFKMFEREKTMDNYVKNYARIIFVVLLVLFLISMTNVVSAYNQKKDIFENTKQTQVYTTVTDKYTKTIRVGKRWIKKYFIDVKLENQKETHKIQISGTEYSSIDIGNEVYCTIYTTDDEIKDIELGKAKEKIETYTFQDYLKDIYLN